MAKILEAIKQTHPITKRQFIDYEPSKDCCNDDSYGACCIKCEKCGRQFINGVLQEGGAE